MNRLVPSYFFLLGLILALSPMAQADWTSFTGAELSATVAEVAIDLDHITLRLEIGDRDREAFASLLSATPAVAGQNDTPLSAPAEQFFHSGFVLTRQHGVPLIGTIKIIEQRKRMARSTPFQRPPDRPQISATVTYVEIVYPLSERPDTLTFTPPLQADGYPAAEIGFIVYHQHIPVIDFQYLHKSETLRLDWRDPWYSAFDNPSLQRHHRAPLMTFLYIEPYEVRVEILMRLKELAAWMPLDLHNPDWIETHEQARLRQQVGQFFVGQSQVQIDGERSRPLLDRVQFVRVTQQGIQSITSPTRLALPAAIIGVILAYVTPGIPQEVTMNWDLFNHRITSVPASMIDPVSALPYDLTPDAPVLTWTNRLANYGYQVASVQAVAVNAAARQLRLPLLSLVLFAVANLLCLSIRSRSPYGVSVRLRVIAGVLMLMIGIVVWPYGRVAIDHPFVDPYVMPEAEVQSILAGLLRNTYRAFDFRREDDIYDALAVSVTDELITDVYLQSRKRLELDDQDGARANVQAVDLINTRQIGPPGNDLSMTFHCTWDVAGSVEHWGHAHWRRNRYEAMITIKPVQKTWKLSALDLTDERRLP
jgi:hypothetical protein